jgi:glycosidase
MKEKKDENNFKWMEGAKIYQVFTDRFAGHKEKYTDDELRKNFLYGNIKALMTKLDYIKSMNFNMIWLTPFYVNQPAGYHGYHAENFNHVDPKFAYGEKIEDNNVGNVFDSNDVELETGADLVLKEFVQECHKKDLKVMMDFVPNHCYETHPYFIDAKKDINSKYRNWFYFIKEEKKEENNTDQSYFSNIFSYFFSSSNEEEKKKKEDSYRHLAFLFFSDLPKLNLENPEVQEHLIKSTKKFLSYGIDAVRVDHAIGPKPEGLKIIVSKIHEEYPNVPFIGEIVPFGSANHSETILGTSKEILEKLPEANPETLKVLDELYLNYIGILDGVLDFSFQYYVDLFVTGKITEEQCIKEIEEHFQRFENHKDFLLLKNIDSHDCDRIMFRCKNNVYLFQKAMKLLYKEYLGRKDPIVVYYGTEDFMTQEKTIYGEPYGDFRCRQPMYFGSAWLKDFFKEN